MPKSAKINDLEKRFCEEYIIDFNGTRSARDAGYSAKTSHAKAYYLLQKKPVRLYLQKLMDKRAKRTEITQDRVVREYEKLAFFDPRKVFYDNGELKDVQDLDDDTAAAVTNFSYKQSTCKLLGKIGRTQDVKFSDKKAALDSLARHLGMFNDKISLGGQESNPIVTENTNANVEVDLSILTDEQMDALGSLAASITDGPEESDFDL